MNLSDGNSDGLVLLYNKDNKVYPVLLTEEQRDMLEIVLSVPFRESKLKVYDKPIGTITNLMEETK